MSVDKKAAIRAYKERPVAGGVYRIRDEKSGESWYFAEVDLPASRNRFEFCRATGLCTRSILQKAWERDGAEAFSFEICETMEKKPEQSLKEFKEDLKLLLQMVREREAAVQP